MPARDVRLEEMYAYKRYVTGMHFLQVRTRIVSSCPLIHPGHTRCAMDIANQPPLKRVSNDLSVQGTIGLVTFYENLALHIVHTNLRPDSENS